MQLTDEQLARFVQEKNPGLEDRLVSAVEAIHKPRPDQGMFSYLVVKDALDRKAKAIARAQLLTGCYGARVSVPGVYGPGGANGLNPSEHTIAERLKEEARKGPLGQAGAHEWLKCSQLEKVKQFGFSMGDVWKTATPTHETDGPRWSHPTSGDPGHQSTQTHKELDAIFEKSNTRDEFLTHLNHWADGKDHDPPQPRLHHGRHSLPEDLQKHR